MNDVSNNGVIQVDTAADLADASLADANIVFVVDEMTPYKRNAEGIGEDKWSVFSGGGIGAPPAPVITNQEGGASTYFTSGGEGDDGPTLAYTATLEPFTDELVEVTFAEDMSGGQVLVTNATSGVDYKVTVYAVNTAGRSEGATTDAFQLNYNDLFGGTVMVVDDYNESGEKWHVHYWDTGGTNTALVRDNPNEFHILSVGGGATGADWSPADHYGPAGGGGGLVEGTMRFDKNAEVTIVVGGAKSGGSVNGDPSSVNGQLVAGGGRCATRGSAGGASGTPQSKGGGGGYMHPDYWLGGGGGGAGGNGAGASAGTKAAGGAGLTSSITGTVETYARGGQGGCCGGNGATYSHPGSGGGAGRGGANASRAGYVAIAYQVGVSTPAEVAAARAVRAARAEAYAAGMNDGLIDGFVEGHKAGFEDGYDDATALANGDELTVREAPES